MSSAACKLQSLKHQGSASMQQAQEGHESLPRSFWRVTLSSSPSIVRYKAVYVPGSRPHQAGDLCKQGRGSALRLSPGAHQKLPVLTRIPLHRLLPAGICFQGMLGSSPTPVLLCRSYGASIEICCGWPYQRR